VALYAIFFIEPGHGALGQKQISAHVSLISHRTPLSFDELQQRIRRLLD
jgi:hypothetical protein